MQLGFLANFRGNMKKRTVSLIVVLGVIGLAACQNEPQKDAAKDVADEQKIAQEKIAQAEKEAAEKTAKAKREADEKIANAAKDLAEKKAEVTKDLAEELADIRYQAFVGFNDYKTLVNKRIDENEKKLIDFKTKGESMSATMSAEAKKQWADAVKVADEHLKVARTEVKNLDTTTEATWAASKAKVDIAVKNFAKSVDNVGKKISP